MQKQMVDPAFFNLNPTLPYELRIKDFELAIQDIYYFFHDVNTLLLDKGLHRFDDMLRPAAMPGIISDMMTASLAKHSRALVENQAFQRTSRSCRPGALSQQRRSIRDRRH